MKILCPTDLTDNPNKPIHFANHIMKVVGGDLLLFHAGYIHQDKDLVKGNGGEITDDEYIAKAQLKELCDRLEKDSSGYGKNVKYESIWAEGFPISAIVDAVKSRKVDLLIMGTTGANRGKFGGIFLESNTAAVVDEVDCPVLVIPYDLTYKGIKKVVYALDVKKYNIKNIVSFMNFINHFNSEVTFLYVAEGDKKSYEPLFEEAKNQISSIIPSNKISFELIQNNKFSEGVKEYNTANKIDLLVMATYKRNVFGKMFDKSDTKKMTYEGEIPLFIIRAS